MNPKPPYLKKIRTFTILLLTSIFTGSCSHNPNQSSKDSVKITFTPVVEPLFERVENAYLSATGSRMNNILDTVFTLDSPAGNIGSLYIDMGSDDRITIRTWFYDENRRPLYRIVESINVSEYSAEGIELQPVQTGFRSGTNVIILRDLPPWDSYGLDSTLAGMGLAVGTGANQFYIYSSSDLPSVEFTPGSDILIISNDQPQGFYNNLFSNLNKVTEFAAAGGTILWETCDLAWNYGSYAAAGIDSFPGGITHRTSYDAINTIFDPDLNLVEGLGDTLLGNYASNKYFSDIPDSAIIYMKDSGGNPTLIELKYGNGIILYSGQPLEYNFDRRNDYNMGFLLPRIISFLLGIPWEQPLLHSSGMVVQPRLEVIKDTYN
ncbi:MAG: hypothetical protein JSW64_11380 [Candidatus Zixiibacteriota bacterium]|nr:MAG: hypothetical protein JSW64_11380 [candidate division Zixibacteria bacterium]